MSVAREPLLALRRDRPEWTPWLDVVELVLREAQASAWDELVPDVPAAVAAEMPRLARAVVAVPAGAVEGLFDAMLRAAARGGTPEMATLARVPRADFDVLPLFRASLCIDDDAIAEASSSWGADSRALNSVLALIPVPFLQACNRRWAPSVSADWLEPYCPVCGAWPAFAEVRGIERSRHYRCGRCGAEWHAHGLSCPFCATTDHHDLVTLVPQERTSAVIEACRRCLGYVKTFNRLQGCAPLCVAIEDLGAVALDLVALQNGYARPAGPGYPMAVTVTDRGAPRRLADGHD